jgi:hypothetical protein
MWKSIAESAGRSRPSCGFVRRDVYARFTGTLLLLLLPLAASAQTITVAWDASSDPTTAGYIVNYGTAPGTYTNQVDVGNVTSRQFTLNPASKYYFAVQAYGADGAASPFSEEISYSPALETVPRVKSPGDLTNDGAPDLVWQHDATGSVVGWSMAGTRVAQQLSFNPSGVPDTAWKIAGRADFNRDGDEDLLWHHRQTGSLAIWLMQGTRILQQVRPSSAQVSDLDWRVVGTGDLNGDGAADILWHHARTGTVVGWLMQGSTVIQGTAFASVGDTNWRIVGTGDVNRDGHLDLLWHHQTRGLLAVWLLDGLNILQGVTLAGGPDQPWNVVALEDMNGDGSLDILWQHRTLGYLGLWVMDGVTHVRTTMLTPEQVGDMNWRITPR